MSASKPISKLVSWSQSQSIKELHRRDKDRQIQVPDREYMLQTDCKPKAIKRYISKNDFSFCLSYLQLLVQSNLKLISFLCRLQFCHLVAWYSHSLFYRLCYLTDLQDQPNPNPLFVDKIE